MLNVLYFSSPTCQPCKIMSPIINELTNLRLHDVSFQKIDTSNDRQSILTHNVSAVPTLIFMKHGNEIKRTIGMVSKEKLIEIINLIK